MNKRTEKPMVAFLNIAHKKGYMQKIVGDYSYSKTRSPRSAYIKLIGAKNGKLQIFETGKGRYEIELTAI